MDLGIFTQSCASAYREIGEAHGWRKGRNAPRGYDVLTAPNTAWDDRPHERYLLLVQRHLSAGAGQLGESGRCYGSGNMSAAVTLARAAFVESAKSSWLLEDGVVWERRAARAHIELLGNLEAQVRHLPKRLDDGYPNFVRKQWQVYRKQLRDEVIVELFGKPALSRDRDDATLAGEELLTSSELEERFAQMLSADVPARAYVAAPDVLIDPSARVAVDLAGVVDVDEGVVARSMIFAVEAWLSALVAWVRYNSWETRVVDQLGRQLAGLLDPAT
ncbi:MAG TPA: hypothetical protein VM282_25330 [Acidimicrobiales bacterium]|nr:hypothetical protein [Acidimicrobiales bacterium]